MSLIENNDIMLHVNYSSPITIPYYLGGPCNQYSLISVKGKIALIDKSMDSCIYWYHTYVASYIKWAM